MESMETEKGRKRQIERK